MIFGCTCGKRKTEPDHLTQIYPALASMLKENKINAERKRKRCMQRGKGGRAGGAGRPLSRAGSSNGAGVCAMLNSFAFWKSLGICVPCCGMYNIFFSSTERSWWSEEPSGIRHIPTLASHFRSRNAPSRFCWSTTEIYGPYTSCRLKFGSQRLHHIIGIYWLYSQPAPIHHHSNHRIYYVHTYIRLLHGTVIHKL